jgi:hypothetical protein
VILRYGAPSSGAEEGPVPPSWFQAVVRASADHRCETGWSPSWAYWPNNGQGGWVCNRETFWDRVVRDWNHR